MNLNSMNILEYLRSGKPTPMEEAAANEIARLRQGLSERDSEIARMRELLSAYAKVPA